MSEKAALGIHVFLAFIIPEGDASAIGRERASAVLPSYDPCELYDQQGVSMCSRGTRTMGATNCPLVGFEACSTGVNLCCKPDH